LLICLLQAKAQIKLKALFVPLAPKLKERNIICDKRIIWLFRE